MASRIAFILVWNLLPLLLTGQTYTIITGKVENNTGDPITGANVFIEGSYDGSSTDLEGIFSFTSDLTGKQTFICSYLGHQRFETILDLNTDSISLNIRMLENPLEMNEIVITAGTFEAGGESRREFLKPLDIVTTAGATADIAGALNTLPGTTTVGETGRLFVRGGDEYETKTFIDGLQVLNFYGPSAPNTPSRSRFLPFMFSGTTFSTGGYSAEYGQALSSALILNSKYIATTDRMDISLLSVGADISFTEAWKNASLSGKFQYTDIEPYFSIVDQEIDWIDPPHSVEGIATYRTKLSDHGLFKIYGNLNRSSFALNQTDLLNPQIKERINFENQYEYLNSTFYETLNRDWEIKGGISYTHNLDRITLNNEETDEDGWGVHGKFTLRKQISHALRLNGGMEHLILDYFYGPEDRENNSQHQFGYSENITASFVESDVRVFPFLLARLGLRSEFRHYTNDLHLSPRISVAIETGENSQISASYGRFQQLPQNKWLMIANGLKNELATHFILNYQVSRNGRTFRIETFHKKYSRLVKFDPVQRFLQEGYKNSGFGTARGFDLFWRDSRSITQADYWISYSYLDTKRDYQNFPYKAVPHFASKHNLSVVYKQFINSLRTQLGLTYSFTSGRPYNDPNLEGFLTEMTKPYHDLSLNLSYLVRQNIIVHLSATNILGNDHVFGYIFSDSPDANGHYPGRAIKPPASRFLFAGIFLTISKDQILNQLPNL